MGLPAAQRRTRTLIVGLGKTGLSCARFLAAHGEEIAITDSRERPPGLADLRALLPDAAVFLGGFSEDALKRADRLVLSPGVAAGSPFVAKARALGMPVLGDIELFAHYAHAPIVGITGANGKSTVTTLLGIMAEHAGKDVRVGGNLGTPALDLLQPQEPDLYVLELSSFQLESTDSLPCMAATVLNLSPDHMDRYAGMKEYAAAKARIFRHCRTAVLNREDPWVRDMAAGVKQRVSFGLDAPPRSGDYGVLGAGDDEWLAKGSEKLMPASVMRMQGRHNLANGLAALALGEAAGLPMQAMLAALEAFRGLPHRMEFVSRFHDVTWYDDSKGTNVGATLAAVQGVTQPLVLIAGGDGKGQDFAPLAAALRSARGVVLLGKDAQLIEDAIAGRVPVKRVKDMDAAVQAAAELAQPGDVVLLSPACSSLDMFENFEHRGRVFAAVVRRLADG